MFLDIFDFCRCIEDLKDAGGGVYAIPAGIQYEYEVFRFQFHGLVFGLVANGWFRYEKATDVREPVAFRKSDSFDGLLGRWLIGRDRLGFRLGVETGFLCLCVGSGIGSRLDLCGVFDG